MNNFRKFRETDNFPENVKLDMFDKEVFRKSLRVLQLEEHEIKLADKLHKDQKLKGYLKAFKISSGFILEKNTNDKEILSKFINNIINPDYLDVYKRLDMLVNMINVEKSVDRQIKFIENLGDYMIETGLDHIEDRKEYTELLKLINKITNLDKSLIWKIYEEITFLNEHRVNNEFKNTLAFLPNMVFRLLKNNEGHEYIIDYAEGNLIDILGFPFVSNKTVNEVLKPSVADKLYMYIETAIYTGMAEFSLQIKDRTIRNIIRSEKVIIDEIEYTQIVGYAIDVTDLNKNEDIVKKIAYYDELTNLPRKELFNKKLGAWVESNADDRYVGVMFVDVDDFKKVNDKYGHNAGDELLKEVAKRLQNCVRNGDLVARYGGDEFTIICRNVKDRNDLEIVVQRIIELVGNKPFELNNGLQNASSLLNITLSIGVAIFPEDATDTAMLLESADIAMYKAKIAGKNSYRFFESSMRSEELTKLAIENDLRNAVRRDEFELYYQLQFDSQKNKVVGLEALIRWDHPEKGRMQPDFFIPIAEQSGLIVEIGYWVLNESCKKLVELINMGYTDLVLGVNFSTIQFKQDDIVHRVKKILEENQVPASSLMIEITESTSMEAVDKTTSTLRELRELGVLISIDDFGTGYSSLNYLKKFPLNNLKIDKSFVKEMTINKENKQLVSSIIALANGLELEIVAEGVETLEQFEMLKEMGCRKFQGYYFSKPISFDDLVLKLNETR
jgi:diguanylate cyclase (GGDEF)-like protein